MNACAESKPSPRSKAAFLISTTMNKRSILFAAALLLMGRGLTPAQDLVLEHALDPTNGVLTLSLQPNPSAYYTLEWTEDFQTFTRVGMLLGVPGPAWAYSVRLGGNKGFFRVQAHDIFSPLDSDGDGIDDRYELDHANCLNPLVYADASQPCLVPGMSN
jgi:hypothetical protein